jgi:[ribosomal protein S18]-alanine N-acetyltransferase
MNAWSIRPSTPFDLEAILQIEHANPSAAHWRDEIYREIWNNPAADRVCFVADDAGELLGFVVGRAIFGEWELENLAVLPGRQRSGIGTALLKKLLEVVANAMGTRLFLEVRESNSRARVLYESHGFQTCGRRKNYYADPPEDALLFEKKFAELNVNIR